MSYSGVIYSYEGKFECRFVAENLNKPSLGCIDMSLADTQCQRETANKYQTENNDWVLRLDRKYNKQTKRGLTFCLKMALLELH